VDTGATINAITRTLQQRVGATVVRAKRGINVRTGNGTLRLVDRCAVVVDDRTVSCWVTDTATNCERLILGLPFIRANRVDLNALFLSTEGKQCPASEQEYLQYLREDQTLHPEPGERGDPDGGDTAKVEELHLCEEEAAKVLRCREKAGTSGEYLKATQTEQSWDDVTIGEGHEDEVRTILAGEAVQDALKVHAASLLDPFSIELKDGGGERLARHKLPSPTMSKSNQQLVDFWAQRQVDTGLATWVEDIGTVKHASRLVVAKKSSKDGTRVRVAIALNGVNAETKPMLQIPLSVDEILRRVRDPRFFSTIDLRAAYHQIALHPDTAPYMHVAVGKGRYLKLNAMPFGAQNAGTHFVHQLHKILKDVAGFHENVYVYIDDIVIMSNDKQEHLRIVREILERLAAHRVTISAKKTHLLVRELDLVGFRVSTERLAMSEAHIEKVRAQAPPRTLTQLRSFLGLVNGDARFVERHAAILQPLRDLLKGKGGEKKSHDISAQWSSGCDQAFAAIKEAITAAPFLHWLTPGVPFEIHTDASQYGVGGIVKQRVPRHDGEMELRTIYHFSRALTEGQRSWATYVKEAFAIYLVVKKFRDHIEVARGETGQERTIVYTDHAPLQWILKSKNQTVQRWATAALSGLPIDYRYLPGPDNEQADALSRFLFDTIAMRTEHAEVMKDIAERVDDAFTLVFAQEEWVDSTAAPARFNVCNQATFTRLLESKATPRTKRLFVKILDSASRDQRVIAKALATGKPCCFILPCALYGELFDDAEGNRIVFLERGTCAVMRNVPWRWADIVHSRGRARPEPSKRGDDESLLLMHDDGQREESNPEREAEGRWKPPDAYAAADLTDPAVFRELVIDTHVSTFHAGAQRVYELLERVLPMGVMMEDERTTRTSWLRRTRTILSACAMCPQVKHGRRSKATLFRSSLLRPVAPHTTLGMDLHRLGESHTGERHILTVIDFGSRRVRLLPMQDCKATTVALTLVNRVVFEQGTFLTLMSDQAREFRSAVVKKLCSVLGIRQLFNAPHSPWSRGVIERVHLEVNVGVRTLEDPNNWPNVIKAIEFAINSTRHTGLGYSPFEMERLHPLTHFRVHDLLEDMRDEEADGVPDLQLCRDAIRAIRGRAAETQQKYVERYLRLLNKDRHHQTYAVGDRILASRKESGIAMNAQRIRHPARITGIDGSIADVVYEFDDKAAQVHLQSVLPMAPDALEITEQALHGFERATVPETGGSWDAPLPEGTLCFAVDDQFEGKLVMSEITGHANEVGSAVDAPPVYEVHYWYTQDGRQWQPAHITQDNAIAGPHQARRCPPWTGTVYANEIVASGFAQEQARGELSALKLLGHKAMVYRKTRRTKRR
jgi:transposase InsO family protein